MNARIALLCLLAIVPLAATADDSQNVKIVQTMIELVNARDLDALGTVVAEDVVRHSDATPGVTVSSLDEFKAFLTADFASIPDSVQEIEAIFGDGDMVAVRARYGGTQSGPMGPFPPSGKTVRLTFMAMLRIENNKIAEIWVEWDNLTILGQLGLLPPAPTTE